MQNDYAVARRNISVMLLPIFDLLNYKQTNLEFSEWLAFLQKTEDSIVGNPEQYFGNDRPSQELTQLIVRELFLEFAAPTSIAKKP